MRQRGIIALLATVPVWAVMFVVAWQYQHSAYAPWQENAPPTLAVGAAQSIVIVTLAALCILGFDLVIWVRGRNGRRN